MQPYRCSIRRYDKATVWRSSECCSHALDLSGTAHVNRADLYSQIRRNGLDGSELPAARGNAWMADNAHSPHRGRDLLQPLEPLPTHAVFTCCEARGIASRSR